jgi:hypothetical protein
MKIEINIKDSHALLILLLITAASAMGLVVAYGGINPSAMGHTWGEMECAGCIINSNLADSSVTTAKIADSSITGAKLTDNAVTSAKIADGSITTADVASIDGSKITGTVQSAVNADMVDGLHASSLGKPTCNWNGWRFNFYDGMDFCPCGCNTWGPMLDFYCSGNIITNINSFTICTMCSSSCG